MKTNSDFNKRLLMLFLLLDDEKEITYESFNEYEQIDPSNFSRLIKEYQMMIIKMNLKFSLVINDYSDSDNEGQYLKKIYYQISIGNDYSFSLDNLDDNDKNRYIYVILFLMLKNHQYVSQQVFQQRLNIDLDASSYKRMFKAFKELVGFDIYKNELQSYVIEVI